MSLITVNVELDNGEDEPKLVELPAHYAICDRCEGTGRTSRHLGAFTQSEWADQDDDFRQDYLSGAYDKPCGCENGKVRIIDREACTTDDQKAALKQLDDKDEWEREARAERRNEARMMGETDFNDYGD